ncbi:SatD family protein [Diaminobutyricimonas aerilata]|uniref:SatD family protein n=1 Tax=Diaminobutyricimonas aerilata TaxID=1162967 RepID=A0A2M9CFC7_9MICO|nr:SatD family protein [Diaminobutyricimonas aerilata]PJJ70646.1 SatD family protein [Diaminobutyricimonas aerilata]
MASVVAIIVDIVRSRELEDRAAAQTMIESTFAKVAAVHPPVRPLWATVGDEFQIAMPDVASAVRTTTLVRLLLTDGVDCRFGLGSGEVIEVRPGASGPIQDGSAWWSARDAIDEARRREKSTAPYARTWYRAAAAREAASEGLVNGLLLLRDELVSGMSPRERRLAAGSMLGRTQVELAADEGVSQSAVSQNLRRSGAQAIAAAMDALAPDRRRNS